MRKEAKIHMETINLQEMSIEEIVGNLIEIRFEQDNDFLLIKETLTRIGIQSRSSSPVVDDLGEACDIMDEMLADYNGTVVVEDFIQRMESKYNFDETPTLYQSCHILQKKGRYYIVHFKELYGLDGKPTNMTVEDIARRNSIARKLESWGLFNIVNPEVCEQPLLRRDQELTIIGHADKSEWSLVPKYTMNRRKNDE